MQGEDLWMIIDDIYEPALLLMCHLYCSPHVQFERQALNLCLKIKVCGCHIRSRAKRWFIIGGWEDQYQVLL